MEKELLDLLEDTLAQTREALKKGEWERPLHTLKGAAANLGGTALFKLCETYERKPHSQAAADLFLAELDNLRGK